MNELKTPWGTVPAGAILSPEWAWVLQHATLIEKHAWKVISGTPLDLDDARGALIADLAAKHHLFNPSKGTPANFIWLRAKAVRRTMVRAGLRAKTSGPEVTDLDAAPPDGRGSSFRMSARAEVGLALTRSDRKVALAMLSVVREWDAPTVKRRLGCTLKARDQLLRSTTQEAL